VTVPAEKTTDPDQGGRPGESSENLFDHGKGGGDWHGLPARDTLGNASAQTRVGSTREAGRDVWIFLAIRATFARRSEVQPEISAAPRLQGVTGGVTKKRGRQSR
jgi:hypothetical protein